MKDYTKKDLYKSGETSMFLLLVISISIGLSFLSANILLIYLSLFIAVIVVILKPYKYGIYLYWIVSFSTQFYTVGNVSASRIVSIVLYLAILIRLLYGGKYSKLNLVEFVLLGVITIYALVSVLYSLVPNLAFSELFTLYINFVFLILISLDKNFKFFDIMEGLWKATIVSLVTVVIIIFADKGLQGIITGDVLRLSLSDTQNAGEFGRNLVAYFGILLFASFYKKNLWIYLVTSFALLLVFLSGSRSSLVGSVTIFVLLLIYNRRSLYKNKIFLTSLIVLGVMIFTIYHFSNVFEYLLNRYTIQNVIESNGARRFIIWDYYIKDVIPHSPIIGFGVGGSSEIAALIKYSNATYLYIKPAHNMFIELFVQFGLFGFLLFMSFYYAVGRVIFSINTRKDYYITSLVSIFVALIVMSLGEPMFYSKIFWIIITLIIKYKLESKSKDYKELKGDKT